MTTTRGPALAPVRPVGDIVALGCLAGAAGLYSWLVFAMSFTHDGVIGPHYNAPGSDYMVYWTAARAALAGNFALLADPVALTAQINQQFHYWLSGALPLHPWLYPPHFLLLLAPFAGLPFGLSYASFQLATFAAAVAGGWCWAGPHRRRGLWLVGLAVAPVAGIDVVCGQNAFLTLALLLGGVGLLGRSDVIGGAILDLLTYKPQFAPLAAVALIASGNWRALAAATASALLAVLGSAALFGIAPWWDWLRHVLTGGTPGDPAWLDAGRLWGLSIWACASLLGAPSWLANAAQALAAILAAACVWLAFRRPLAAEHRMAALLTATLLAAPHSEPYDLTLLAAAALLLFRVTLDDQSARLRPSLLLALWAAPLLTMPRATPLGYAVPLLMAGFLVFLVAAPRPAASLTVNTVA